MKKFVRIMKLLVLIAPLKMGIAQIHYEHFIYNQNNGLEYPFGRGMVQDNKGFLWTDHDAQISRFDGYEFRIYRNNPSDSLQNIGQSLIGRLQTDEIGNLWMNNLVNDFGGGSIFKYDARVDGFKEYKPDVKGQLINWISYYGSDSSIWLGGRGGAGLFEYKLHKATTVRYLNELTSSEHAPFSNHISVIEAVDNNNLLLSTKHGLWLFDKTNKKFTRQILTTFDSLEIYKGFVVKVPNRNWIINLDLSIAFKINYKFECENRYVLPQNVLESRNWKIDLDDKFWYLNDEGVFRYDPAKSETTKVYDNTLDNVYLSELFVDKNNNIWFTSELGLNKLVMSELEYFVHPINNSKVERPDYVHILRRSNPKSALILGGGSFKNSLWQTQLKHGQRKFQKIEYKGQDENPSNLIFAWEGKKFVWIATTNNGVMGIPIDSKSGLIDKSGILFFKHIPDNNNTITSNSVWSVYEDNDNMLWVAANEGLSKIDLSKIYGTSGSVTRYIHDPADSNSMSSNIVRQLFPESSNSFWVATERGVDLFKDGKFKNYFKDKERVGSIFKLQNGDLLIGTFGSLYIASHASNYGVINKTALNADFDFIIGEDSEKRLWIPTRKGLFLFNPETGQLVNLSYIKLFSSAGSITKTDRGTLLFCSKNNLVEVNPSTITISKNSLTPLLTSFLVNNKIASIYGHVATSILSDFVLYESISESKDVTLDYKHNNFTFEFSAMDLTAPENIIYKYRLDGYDRDWVQVDAKNRRATYTNLSPGTYLFRVKASNHLGVWSNNERTLQVIILPPPWRTWWANTGYGFIVIGLLYWARINIVQRERLKSNLALTKLEQEREHFELEKAKEVDRMKTSFFANISHEFRTPLTLIKGPVQDLMERYSNEPKTLAKLTLIQHNSDFLLRLINQLLDLAKLESGAMKVEKSKGNIRSFINAIVSSFHSFAEQKKVTINTELSHTPYEAIFDKDKVETILINLINNALKFTPSGGAVTIKVDVLAQFLTLIVIDTGIGIPEEHQIKIFERFHQVSESHNEVGTGIGLALVKEVVTLLGGTISVKSKPGEGSEFIVTIPIEEVKELNEISGSIVSFEPSDSLRHTLENFDTVSLANGKPQSTSNHELIAEDTTKPRILVVEDNTDLRSFIIDCLGSEFNFLEAENGKQGLEVATREIPDLILSDVMMPEMDGITMAGKIKSDGHTCHIPLILLTAKSTEDSKLIGLQRGADDYLTKPFNKNELLLKVRNGVIRQQKLREKLRAELMSTAPKVEVLSADEQFLNRVKARILERLGDEQLSVESLADDMGMSRVQLYRKVSGLTDLSVNELIRKLRLQRAAQLISQKWGPVSQVAYEVGISNLSYFSKVFKEEFGVLPSDYAA